MKLYNYESMSQEERYWIGFSYFEGIGPLRFKLLLEYFGSVQKAWEAPEKKLVEIGLGEKLTKRFVRFRGEFPFEKVSRTLEKRRIAVITRTDKLFPKLLAEIPDPPIVLYIRGKRHNGLLNSPCVGVVGTRKITNYGRDVTRKISTGLAAAGVTIVSGMAYGVDTVAHQTAIDSGGKTIAVLGCGVDVIYPRENEKLYWDIVEKHGAVISEFPPGRITAKGLFPSRNRIISGLSLGTVVTEGASDSGALITAKCALEQGREVFAVPGPITSSLSAAPTLLLKQGAKLVTDAKDILDELKIKISRNRGIHDAVIAHPPAGGSQTASGQNPQNNLSSEELKIIGYLERENLHFDDLVRKTQIPAAKLGGLLTVLEMKKVIRCNGSGGVYGLIL